jgi:crotonobetainyl-CoA:carnitine CoA-transferase CaiB-like acyl-CoA transferase
MGDAPLSGLRVVELATGIAGPYAGRLLAMLGADVIKVEPEGGDEARRKQLDDAALPPGETSPLFWHLNAGKRNVSPGLVDLAGWPDVVLDSRVRRETGPLPDGPLWVSVTPWGFGADESGGIDHEVLVQARSGAIGATGNPDGPPLRFPGWQAQYSAGATAAVAALVGLRLPGVRHLDVPWVGVLQTGVELLFADALWTGLHRPPAGPHPPVTFPGGALPCKDGFVAPGSFREVDWELQCLFYGMPELVEDERYRGRSNRAQRVDELWERIEPWYRANTMREIFQYTLDSPWAVGMVLTGSAALADEHLAARDFFGSVTTETGESVAAPSRPFLMPGLPVADHRVRRRGEDDASLLPVPRPPAPSRTPLAGLRLLEVTVAWAGPFVGNFLGALGLDVIRFESLKPFEGYRMMRIHADGDAPRHAEHRHTNRWFEVSSIYNAVNRNKRNLVTDLTTEGGKELFLTLAAEANVVLCNFTARVLPNLGLGYEELRAVNDDIVVVRMPAFGTSGPYSHCAGYALVIEGMGGFGARFGTEEEGARISDTYWPDSVAGTHAALAIAAALERRARTGRGCEVDFAHMEAMWCQMGEWVLAADRWGRDLQRMGNREPGVAGAGIVPAAGGGWEAVVGARRERVNDAVDAAADPGLQWRFETVDHPVCGPMPHLRAPLLVDGQPTVTQRHAPLFDQHTDQLLAEAGYSPERIAALRAARAVGGTMPLPAELGR